MSVGSGISNGKGAPDHRGNGVPADPAKEVLVAAGDSKIGDPEGVSVTEVLVETSMAEAPAAEISGVEIVVHGNPVPLPGLTSLSPISGSPTPPPTSNTRRQE